MHRHFIRYFLAFVLALTVVAPAVAQATDTNADSIMRKRFSQGKKLFKGKRYAQACSEFEAAVEAQPKGVGAWAWLGRCYLAMEKRASAYAALRTGRKKAELKGDAANVAYIDSLLVKIEPDKLPQLKVIVSEAAHLKGLTLSLDGTPLSSAGWNLPFPSDPGKRVLVVSAPGFEPQVLEVVVGKAEGTATLMVPTLAPAKTPQLQLIVPPEAQVEGLELVLDGRLLDPEKWNTAFAAEPGKRTLAVSAPDHEPQLLSISVSDEVGEPTSFTVPTLGRKVTVDVEESSSRTTLGWVAGGVGVAAAIGGTFLYLQGLDRIDKWCDGSNRGQCDSDSKSYDEDAADHFDTGVREKNYGIVGWVAGGLLVTGGIVLLATAPSKSEPATAHFSIAPSVGPGAGGLVARGSF